MRLRHNTVFNTFRRNWGNHDHDHDHDHDHLRYIFNIAKHGLWWGLFGKTHHHPHHHHHHNYHYRHHNLLLIITNVIIRRHCLKFHHDCWTESYACSADLPSPSLLQKVLIGLCLRKYSLQSMAQIRISLLLFCSKRFIPRSLCSPFAKI